MITGAHAMVTEKHDWSERTAGWIPGVIDAGVPLMGICYGHQLIAHALGGHVDYNPRGAEYGTVKIRCTAHYQENILFGHLPPQFDAFASHSQSVIERPPGAQLLAGSALEPVQACFLPPLTWGVQFHPEFNPHITAAYIRATAQKLLAAGLDPGRLVAGLRDTPFSHTIIKRFADIALTKR